MSIPVVGAHFRPPAKAIIDSLPAGHELKLIAEPDNQFDPQAIKVEVTTESIKKLPPNVLGLMRTLCEQFGHDLDGLLEDYPAIHVGYIPRAMTHEVHPKLTNGLGEATLGFTSTGRPAVVLA